MKKFSKILSSLMIAVLLFSMMSISFANDGFNIDITPEMPVSGEAGVLAGKIIGAMRWIGYIIAIGMLVYIGIKYIMASADEKASLKGALVKYIIGAVLIVAAVSIADWVFNLV